MDIVKPSETAAKKNPYADDIAQLAKAAEGSSGHWELPADDATHHINLLRQAARSIGKSLRQVEKELKGNVLHFTGRLDTMIERKQR